MIKRIKRYFFYESIYFLLRVTIWQCMQHPVVVVVSCRHQAGMTVRFHDFFLSEAVTKLISSNVTSGAQRALMAALPLSRPTFSMTCRMF